MGRPRTAVSILEARGSFGEHPERRRVDPETTGELGKPPAHMDADRAAIWYELASILPVGVARNADRFAVELLCDLMFKFRSNSLKAGDLTHLLSLIGRLGLSPVDRARVSQPVINSKEANPFQTFVSQ